MKDIDIIVYEDMLRRRRQEKEYENRIQLEIPEYLDERKYKQKEVEDNKEPRRVIIIDL